MTAYFALLMFTALASFLSRSNPFRYIIFFIPTIYIIGFRYEVGFDWPGYKDTFSQLSELGFIDFFMQLPALTVLYAQEPLYLIIAFLSSKTLISYEYMQAGITVLFLYSTYKLGKALGVQNIIAAFIPIHLFLLFTLEFSAIRQNISISLFNLGLAFFLQNKKTKSVWFYSAALFTQVSTVTYLFAQLWASASNKWIKTSIIFSSFVAIFLASGGLALLPISLIPGLVGAKLDYYIFSRGYQYNVLEQVFYVGVFLSILVILIRSSKKMGERARLISTVVIFLCLFAFMAFWVNTIRNRLMYEIIIISSLLSYGPVFPRQLFLRYILLSSGALFFMISLTKQTNYMYVPYQNYIWYQANGYEGDGLDRFDRLRQLLIRTR